MAFTVQREQRNHDFAQAGRRARSMLEQDKKTLEAEEQRAKEYAKKAAANYNIAKTSGGKSYGAEQTEKKAAEAAEAAQGDMPWWKDLLLSGIGDAESAFGSYNPTPQERSRVGNTLNAAGKSTTASNLNALGFLLDEDESGQDAAWDAFGADSIYNASKGTWETPKKPEDYELESVKRAKEKASNWAYKKANEFRKEAEESEKLAKDGLGKAGQTLVDIGIAGSQLAGDVALNAALPGAGLAAMGVRSFGSATEKARNEGADMQQQFNYGVTVAAAEVLSEKLFDAAKLFGGGGADDVVERIVSKLAKTDAGRTATRILLSGVGEGAEEAVTDLVEPAIRGAFYDKEAMLATYGSPEGRRELAAQAAYDALIGGVLGVAGGGVGILNGENAQKNAALRTQEQLRQAGYTGTVRQKTKADLEREARQADLFAGNLYRPGDPTRQLTADAAPVETTQPVPEAQEKPQENSTLRMVEEAAGMREPAQSQTQERTAEAVQSEERYANRQPQEYTPEDHIDNRTDEYLAKRSVKSFQYNHPELHEYYEAVARDVLEMVDGSLSTDQYRRGMGTVTHNTPALQSVLEETGLTRAELGRALEAIVNDHGAENYAAAKRTEKALDSLLVNGYYTRGSNHVPPNQAYLNAKGGIVGGTDANSWEYYRDNNLSLALGEITEEEAYNDWRAQRDAREAAKAAQEQSQNSDNFAGVQQREAETDAGQRDTLAGSDRGLPQGTGAKSAEFGYDEARTQTHSTDGVLTDNERAMEGLRPEDRTHKVNHDEEVNAKAQERFESDYEGEKADLFGEKQDWDDTDTVLAHKIIVKEVAKARESGSKDAYAEVAKLMKEWDAHGTEAGQALRQRRQLASDPALMEADAIQLMNDSERTRKMSDEQRKKILDIVSQNAEKLRSIEKGDVDGLVDLIKDMSTERRTNGLWSNNMGKMMEKALEQAKKLPGGEAFLRDIAASQVRGIAYDYAKPSTLEQIKAYRYLSMLSKPATAARNLTGNMVYDPSDAVSNNIGVGLDILLSKYTGTRSVPVDKSYFSKTKRKGMGEAALKSYIEIGLDASVSNAQGKYETGGSRSYKMTGNFLERFLSTWEKYSNYAMVTSDQMQKGGIQAEAQRGIDALEAKGKVAKGALDGRAEEIARERTFQNDSKLSGVMGGMRNALNKLSIKDKQGGSIGLGDIMLPFTNVPGNIASAAIQNSPVGFIKAGIEVVKVLNKAKAGTLTAAEQAKAVTDFGRAFNGTMGIALFAVLAGAGVMNVAGDKDKDKEALEKSEGVSGTQLNLSALSRLIAGESTEWRDGDDLVSIGFLDPINAQMTYGALLADCYEEDGKITFGDVTRENLSSIYQSVMELPAMSQFQEIENSLKNSKAETAGGKLADATFRYGASQATSFIPNIVSGVAQGLDGTVRDTYNGDTALENGLRAIKSKIPGLRETLPAALDNWGQEKKYAGTAAENFLNATLNPGSVTKYRTNAVNQELYRLGENIDIKYPEKKAPNSANFDGEKQDITGDQRETYQKTYGQTAYSNVKSLINSAQYGKMSDGERAAAINYLYQYATTQAKKKVGADGGETPSWTSKSKGNIAENAAYRAFLDTARAKATPMYPSTSTETNGAQMQGTLKLNLSDAYKLNVFAQFLGEGAQEHVHEAYSKGYSLQQITDFYQAMNLKDESGKAVYKKDDLIRWATQNGFTYGQAQTMYRIFHPSKKNG